MKLFEQIRGIKLLVMEGKISLATSQVMINNLIDLYTSKGA